MKVVGLITEYNPFHNGHKYHVEEAKRLTGAEYAIAVMSGNFVQRGAPAVIDKYSRTEMALRNGVDLVLELPVCYATGSAEFFAHGAVSLLNRLGIVDFLCFGSESGDISLLQQAARIILNPPASFDKRLRDFMKDGLSYPAARLKALEQSIELGNDAERKTLLSVLTEPNNILGIEYLKAIYDLSSNIFPVTIKRKSAHYHDTEINNHTSSSDDYMPSVSAASKYPVISSATAIRRTVINNGNASAACLSTIESCVPGNVYHVLSELYLKTFPITEEDFSQIIKYKLLFEDKNSLTSCCDISDDLADRLMKLNINELNTSISELADRIKTKNITLSRINRALFHLLLNIRRDNLTEYNESGYSKYARVLGVRKDAFPLLRKIDKAGQLPLITKVAAANEKLDALGIRMLSEDLLAAHLYNQAVYEKYQSQIENEYKHGIIII